MNLALLGWSDAFGSYESQIENLARITAVHRSHLRAVSANGELNIQRSSTFKQTPAVGDWIVTSPTFIDEQGQTAALIEELVPRKSKISRISSKESAQEQLIAANVDTVFLITSINQDFNLNRLQRYLLLIKEGSARPVIILSKVDLDPTYKETIKNLSEKLSGDVLVLPSSSLNKLGAAEVKKLMPEGSTSVFIGSSGVGKSSLVNALLEEDLQAVSATREFDNKGRHTTTARQMHFIPNGGMIIDTPGVRQVSVFGSEDNLADTFSEVEELFTKCKFSNCSHTTETSCAVLKALENKSLDKKKWDSYLKLQKEVALNNDRLNKEALVKSKKDQRKKTQKDYKARKKFKDRG